LKFTLSTGDEIVIIGGENGIQDQRLFPLFQIASYLGIQPKTLSRIRTKKLKTDLHQAFFRYL